MNRKLALIGVGTVATIGVLALARPVMAARQPVTIQGFRLDSTRTANKLPLNVIFQAVDNTRTPINITYWIRLSKEVWLQQWGTQQQSFVYGPFKASLQPGVNSISENITIGADMVGWMPEGLYDVMLIVKYNGYESSAELKNSVEVVA
jgi:hypothetical protein